MSQDALGEPRSKADSVPVARPGHSDQHIACMSTGPENFCSSSPFSSGVLPFAFSNKMRKGETAALVVVKDASLEAGENAS